jgi:hypothetical protein
MHREASIDQAARRLVDSEDNEDKMKIAFRHGRVAKAAPSLDDRIAFSPSPRSNPERS